LSAAACAAANPSSTARSEAGTGSLLDRDRSRPAYGSARARSRADDHDRVGDGAELVGLLHVGGDAERLGDPLPELLRLRRRLRHEHLRRLDAEALVVARAHEHEVGRDQLGPSGLADARADAVEHEHPVAGLPGTSRHRLREHAVDQRARRLLVDAEGHHAAAGVDRDHRQAVVLELLLLPRPHQLEQQAGQLRGGLAAHRAGAQGLDLRRDLRLVGRQRRQHAVEHLLHAGQPRLLLLALAEVALVLQRASSRPAAAPPPAPPRRRPAPPARPTPA
jgi:hypothetical protein